MLRLKEVASQFESFSKRVWKNKNAIDLCCFPGPPPAGRLNSFLLTGRLYWLLAVDAIGGCVAQGRAIDENDPSGSSATSLACPPNSCDLGTTAATPHAADFLLLRSSVTQQNELCRDVITRNDDCPCVNTHNIAVQ